MSKPAPKVSLLWAVLYYLVAQNLPATSSILGKVSSGIRASLIQRFAYSIGRRVDISRKVMIGLGRDLIIGDDSGLGVGVELHGPVEIGRHVMVSPGVLIHTRNHRFSDPDTNIGSQGYSDVRKVVIGDDCWIGARSILLPGTNVGAGSVIGAGSVVRGEIPPLSIVVGNPAEVVGQRMRRKLG